MYSEYSGNLIQTNVLITIKMLFAVFYFLIGYIKPTIIKILFWVFSSIISNGYC